MKTLLKQNPSFKVYRHITHLLYCVTEPILNFRVSTFTTEIHNPVSTASQARGDQWTNVTGIIACI